jgi:hypothetical protein
MTPGITRAQWGNRFKVAAQILHLESSNRLGQIPIGETTDPVMLERCDGMLGCIYGAMILQAFSVELILKALLTKNGVSHGNSHDLWKLFSALPEAERNQLESSFAETAASTGSVSSGSLQEVIRRNADTFTNFRYPDEYLPQHAEFGALATAFDTLKEHLAMPIV